MNPQPHHTTSLDLYHRMADQHGHVDAMQSCIDAMSCDDLTDGERDALWERMMQVVDKYNAAAIESERAIEKARALNEIVEVLINEW